MRIRQIAEVCLIWAIVTIFTVNAEAQQSAIVNDLVNGVAAGVTTDLTGYAITAIGLNTQSNYQTSVLSQLSAINTELNTISAQLASIQNAIQTQTCVDALSSSSVTDSLASIATVSNTYTNLLEAGEVANGTVTQADLNNFLTQVSNGPGGSYPSIASALVTINIALQSTNNDGIIGSCERAISSTPAKGSFGADATFYSDPINLLQYFADYQTVAALLLVEYYNYEAFLSSPYYSATTVSNGLPANEAAEICLNPTGDTATQCTFAHNVLDQLFVYLQNQYSASGVPYSVKDTAGNLATGLYMAGNNTNYLFAASLEEFTNFEDTPQNDCPSVLTSGGSAMCGLTYSDNPSANPFYPVLYSPVYEYETGWTAATAQMWASVLTAFTATSDKSSTTLSSFLTSLGFQNAANKIILTPNTYTANVVTTSDSGDGDQGLSVFTAEAVCFLDTNMPRSFDTQPWCYNGSNNGIQYGNAGDLVGPWAEYHNNECIAFAATPKLISTSNDPYFYGYESDIYYSQLGTSTGKTSSECTSYGYWENGNEPGWLIQNGLSGFNYFWPAINVSSPTCGTNLSYGLLQPAVARSATNFLGVPTMCGADFDRYFANIAPRNPYEQVVFTSSAVSGGGSSTASLGPITIQLQDTSTGVAVALAPTSATTINLTSSSLTGVFSLTQNGASVSTLTIPAGSSTATFYYGDSTSGTPQITADPGSMVPGVQDETIESSSDSASRVSGTVQHVGSGEANGTITLTGLVTLPKAINLDHALLTLWKVLSEDDNSGAGELVHRDNGDGLELPIVLYAIKGSTAENAVYQSPAGASPRIHLAITSGSRKDGRSEFQMSIDMTKISEPAACGRSLNLPLTARLHTRLYLDDSIHATGVYDSTLLWKCHKNGELTTPASQDVNEK